VRLDNAECRGPSSSDSNLRSFSNSTAVIRSRGAREACNRSLRAATRASCSVAVGSTAALICDTGALLDYVVKSAPDHERFRRAIDRARTRYVPGLVLAEVDYFLRDERKAMKALVDDLASGAFTYAAPTVDQMSRAMEIDRRYGQLGLGLVDASVVVLAEDLGIRRLATRDVRDFAAVRLRDGSPFELVVYPENPDR
jgi:uncharacterized protein